MSDEQALQAPKGYEVSAHSRAAESVQRAILEDIGLRKWCIERALEDNSPEPLTLSAERILDFLVTGTVPKKLP